MGRHAQELSEHLLDYREGTGSPKAMLTHTTLEGDGPSPERGGQRTEGDELAKVLEPRSIQIESQSSVGQLQEPLGSGSLPSYMESRTSNQPKHHEC